MKHYEDLTPLADVLTEAGYDAADYIEPVPEAGFLKNQLSDYLIAPGVWSGFLRFLGGRGRRSL